MRYLLDSDTLIRAKNEAFAFDICPAFWTWLERLNQRDIVFSIDSVKGELIEEGDQLSNWARAQGSEFFRKTTDADTVRALKQVSAWAWAHDQFSDAAKNEFLAAADHRLVGHALAIGATVVTFEKHEPDAIEAIKLPTACKAFAVKCTNLWALRRAYPDRFVIESQ